MANPSYRQNAFNAGEISPRLKGRSDLDKYPSALGYCRNAIILPTGGVSKRPGFHHINSAKYSDRYAVLLPFVFSEDQSYVLEFGDLYTRFFMDGGRITEPDANTLLLLHCDGPDKSIAFTDDGATGHAVTAYGNAQVDTAQYKFASGSALFDGAGDYLSAPDHANWNYGATAFTIEFRFRLYANSGISVIYYQKDTTLGDHVLVWIDHEEGKVHLQITNAGASIVNESFTWYGNVDTWYYFAIIRGWGSVANDWAITSSGTAIHTFTNAGVCPDHDQDLLLGGNLGNNYVLDYTGRHPAWTIHSAPTINGAASKFGDASWKFDGTDDYLECADHADWDLSSQTNFTVDFWVYLISHAAISCVLQQYEDNNNYWSISHTHGSGWKFVQVQGGVAIIDTGYGGEIVDAGAWHHVAVCKVGTAYGIYLDGVQVAFVDDASTDTLAGVLTFGANAAAGNLVDGHIDGVRITHANSFSAAPNVGLTNTITPPTTYSSSDANTKLLIRGDATDLYGWLDEIRISDVARWTANFTPPNSEYPGAGGGVTYEIVSPYSQHEVNQLTYLQSADTIYLFHPNHNVYKLVRSDHSSWAISEIDWDQPPWNSINTTAITLDPSATTGIGIDVVASAPFFSQNHVGAYFKQANGYYRITAVTDSLNAVATVKDDLDDHVATADWYQGCWDGTQGFPTMGTFHEDRLCVIGDAAHPLTVFMSETGNYENMGAMTSPIADSDPLARVVWTEGQNKLVWIKSGKKLFMGTRASEFWMTGETIDAPITPTSILVRKESSTGSEPIMPIAIGDDIIFVQRGARRLQGWSYRYESDSYGGIDLSILADHLTNTSTILGMAYAQDPSGIIWSWLSDGYLMGLTYLKDHKVVGFHLHNTGASGIIESACVIPGDYDDELWALICRHVDGGDVRYIERLDPQFFGGSLATNDGIFVDSCLTYVGFPANTFSGMDHLEGETVQVLADGIDVGTEVIASGEFTIFDSASYVVAGLAYNMNLETLTPDLDLQSGNSGNKLKRIVEALFQIYDSGNFKFGRDSANLLSAGLTSAGATYTGNHLMQFNGEHAFSPSIYIRADAPTPLTLLSIAYEMEVEDD